MTSAILASFLLGLAVGLQAADVDWPVYLGDKASTHFSPLRQINRKNVRQLQVAWTYHSGDAGKDDRSQIQCNPLVIDGALYGTSPQLKLVALEAASGRELWSFDPFAASPGGAVGVNRGVVCWAEGTDRRVLWQSKLPAGGYATPATYIAQGRQYLVIACGGGKMGTKSGDAYIAFALPERR